MAGWDNDKDNNHVPNYEDGLREGRLRSMEGMIETHSSRLDRHESRLTAQERITYALLGAIALIELLPTIKVMLGG